MDLIIFLFAFVAVFLLFISLVYFLAKWIFPKTREEDDYRHIGTDSRSNVGHPRISRNPYTFK